MNQSVVNEINNINVVIDDNISEKDYLNRGLLSQNILAQLRNLVEDVIVLWYNKNNNTDLDTHFENKKIAFVNYFIFSSIKYPFKTYLLSLATIKALLSYFLTSF